VGVRLIAKLGKYIDSKRGVPFKWGVNDCCTFTLGAVAAMTGRTDLVTDNRWTNQREASKAIKASGGTLLSAVTNFNKAVGAKEISTRYAGVCDVVVFNWINGQTCGICLGRRVVCTGTEGLIFIPMAKVDLVGCFRLESI
jgi:hypothetical protein